MADAGGKTLSDVQIGGNAPCPLLSNVDRSHGTMLDVLDTMQTEMDATSQNQAMTVGPLLATTATTWYVNMPCKCDVVGVDSCVTVALDASSVITASVVANSVAMTSGALTIGADTTASLVGAVASVTPTANNEVAAGASISIAADGDPTAGEVFYTITYTPKV